MYWMSDKFYLWLRGVLDTTLYDIKFISDLRQVRGFLWVLRFPPTIKLPRYNCQTEILLKVVLNTINLKQLNLNMNGPDSGGRGAIRVVIIRSGPDSVRTWFGLHGMKSGGGEGASFMTKAKKIIWLQSIPLYHLVNWTIFASMLTIQLFKFFYQRKGRIKT